MIDAVRLALAPEQEEACDRALAEGLGLYRIDKLFRRGLSREAFAGLPVMEDVRELGELIAVSPAWEAYDQGPEEQVVRVLFSSARSFEALSEIIFDPLLTLRAPAPVSLPDRRPGPLRMLIVEDDAASGHLLQYILAQQGACELLTSGEGGLARWREALDAGSGFDLVILDLHLPDLSGMAVLRAIRETEFRQGLHRPEQRSVVIINTASEDLETLRASLVHEPDGYLIKPVDIEVLLEKVQATGKQRGL